MILQARLLRRLMGGALFVSALGLVGCSSVGIVEAPAERMTDPGETFEVRQPSSKTIEGIDVSYFQGDVDWHAVAADKIRFAWIKATEGGDRVDEKFRQNFDGAAAAGVLRGAYHFWYHCRSGAEQAAWYIRNVPRDASALPPVLDIEWTPTSPTCRKQPPADQIYADMQAFLDAVQAYYGKRPVIYTSVDFYRDRLVGAFQNYPLWVRSVAAEPQEKYGNRFWHFWQYTSTGQVKGVPGKADRNVFHGTSEEFEKFLAESVIAR
ncbi:glycoside hydrolase family 25 protein [Oryzibacter oryziterrae]|uniref:glycoside hydrolase family 25 protein n=1 Tax=Oryzibacter oryziterrae TaxID=2766474 RepID=UPI001F2E91B7|nr:glycoside hydrolase family 25 protein [Oryzibacter oryziterrae]